MIVDLHKVKEVNRSHDVIDEFKLLVNNLSTIIESMQDMMRVFIPDGMMTFRRDQWDRWTLLDMVRAVVEDKSLNSVSRLHGCARLLSVIMPIELTDEFLFEFDIKIDEDDANRYKTWVRALRDRIMLNILSENMEFSFLWTLNKIYSKQIEWKEITCLTRFEREKNRISELEDSNPNVFYTWTRRVKRLEKNNFAFSLTYIFRCLEGDPSVQPKKLELKQPILAKTLYYGEMGNEPYLMMMLNKFGVNVFGNQDDRDKLVKRMSQKIGLLLPELLYVFKLPPDQISKVLINPIVMDGIFTSRFYWDLDALFTVSGEWPNKTLHCAFMGPNNILFLNDCKIFLSTEKNRWEHTFMLGETTQICCMYENEKLFDKIYCGISAKNGEIELLCAKMMNDGEPKLKLMLLNCVKKTLQSCTTPLTMIHEISKAFNSCITGAFQKVENSEHTILACKEMDLYMFFIKRHIKVIECITSCTIHIISRISITVPK